MRRKMKSAHGSFTSLLSPLLLLFSPSSSPYIPRVREDYAPACFCFVWGVNFSVPCIREKKEGEGEIKNEDAGDLFLIHSHLLSLRENLIKSNLSRLACYGAYILEPDLEARIELVPGLRVSGLCSNQ